MHEQIKNINTLDELSALYTATFGKNGTMTARLKQMKDLDNEARAALNRENVELRDLFKTRQMEIETAVLMLVGIVMDVANNFARVRALTDADTNITVRFVGTDVYAIMTGNGTNEPAIGFFSRSDFTPANGTRIVTSNISGVLPAGIPVGKVRDKNDADVTNISEITRVIVLKFDTQKNEYK